MGCIVGWGVAVGVVVGSLGRAVGSCVGVTCSPMSGEVVGSGDCVASGVGVGAGAKFSFACSVVR